MWFTRKNKQNLIESGILNNMTDIHSHILWGVDDGAKSELQSIAILRALHTLGIRRTFATPHMMATLPNNTVQSLEAAFNEKLALLGKEMNVEVKLAAEYMLDEVFLSIIKNNGKLLTYDGKHVLIEFSHVAAPLRLNDFLFEIKSSGYIPVLAHPERYGQFMSVKELERLKGQGVKFQLNLLSLVGVYRQPSEEFSKALLNADMYDFTGTDAHSENMVNMLKSIYLPQKHIKSIEKLIKNNNQL